MTRPHRVYVGTIGQGVFRSLDGGETFRRAADGMFVECHVRALTLDPLQPSVMWLGTERGLYVSGDGADNWTEVAGPLSGLQLWAVWANPLRAGQLVVGSCPSRIFWTTDGGRSWAEGEAPLVRHCPRILDTRVTCIIGDPADPDLVWAGVEIGGVVRGRDGGRTWQAVGTGLSSQDIHAMVGVPHASGLRLLATTNNDLNRSDDGGETWRPYRIGDVLPYNYCRALTQQASRPEVVLMGIGEGPPGSAGAVARSTDGGLTWNEARMPGRANSTIWNFAVHPADPELIYCSSVSGQVYRSTDGGESWTRLGREFGEIRGLAWTPE